MSRARGQKTLRAKSWKTRSHQCSRGAGETLRVADPHRDPGLLKRAFPTPVNRPKEQINRVWIDLQADADGQIILNIGNNVTDLSEALDIQHPKTLGLQLVIRLVQQLKGTLELDHSQGTVFKITFRP